MKWLLFIASLIALLFAYNALFMMPGNYDWLNFTVAGIAVSVAALLAWLSGRRFAPNHAATLKELMLSPPAVIWIFVVAVFCCVGIIKLFVYRSTPN